MSLDDERSTKVALLARATWAEMNDVAVELHGEIPGIFEFGEPTALLELNPHKPLPNRAILSLFRYIRILREDTVPTRANESPVIGASLDKQHSKAASWLARMRSRKTGKPYAVILLDHHRLAGETDIDGVHNEQLQRAINLLCLHEVGHLLMHWEFLIQSFDDATGENAQREEVAHATEIQEMEAWCFCYGLIGMGVEFIASDFRSNPNKKHVWEYIRDGLL